LKVIPSDGFVSVGCDLLGIDDGALCVVGQMGESYGFALFYTVADAIAYTEAIDEMEAGGDPHIPQFVMFSYDDRARTGPVLMREIQTHGWEIAGPTAYPSVWVIDEDRIMRGLTRAELIGTTAIIEAISELIEETPDLPEAWGGGRVPSVKRSTVATPLGDVGVDIGAPLWLPNIQRKKPPRGRRRKSRLH
jgi:hypothetical protein